MRSIFIGLLLLSWELTLATGARGQQSGDVALWLTTADRSQLLTFQSLGPKLRDADSQPKAIVVDDGKTFQTVDGFGFAMTGGSAQLLHRMDPAQRHTLLKEIFGRGRARTA